MTDFSFRASSRVAEDVTFSCDLASAFPCKRRTFSTESKSVKDYNQFIIIIFIVIIFHL